MRRELLLGVLSACLGGCTTMEIAGDAGKEISEGNIFSGLFLGTFGVIAGAAYDVVTLGGSMDAETSTKMWTDVATQQVQADAQRKQAEAERIRQLEQQRLQQQIAVQRSLQTSPQTIARAQPASINQIQQPHTQLSEPANPPNTSARTYRTAAYCISIDRTSNSLAHFIVNSCNFDVHYTYVVPSSNQLCRIGSPCGFKVTANQKESSVNHKGDIRFVACEYPASAKATDGSRWTGHSTAYRCSN